MALKYPMHLSKLLASFRKRFYFQKSLLRLFKPLKSGSSLGRWSFVKVTKATSEQSSENNKSYPVGLLD